ncbi:MAG: ATPase [Candidatus Aenigmarchaeota archaeon]|nr:ATPase [Candidatus Aenigmarchaeota archaeon]
MADAPRTSTGIPGLDSLMSGGFLENSVNLLTGETGTGKTIFCSQFIWNGLQRGETGLYITLEERPEDIKADAMQFGWDFDSFEKKGLCRIIYHDPAQVNNLGSVIIDEIKNLKAKRLVIDSTSLIGLNLQEPSQIRKMLLNIVNIIKRTGCVAILISEIPEDMKSLSRFGVEEFVVDSVIILNYLEYASGELNRSLIIRKMRRTNHGKDIYPMEMSNKGIAVKKVD